MQAVKTTNTVLHVYRFHAVLQLNFGYCNTIQYKAMTTNHYRYERQNEEIKNHKHYRLFCILCTNSILHFRTPLLFFYL
jgi:hypothetical protein